MIAITRLDPPVLGPHQAVLAALHAMCFSAPWSAAEMDQLLAMPGAFAAVADSPGGPGGFHITRFAADEAEIISIGVRPSARRTGLGAALLRDAMDRSMDAGARMLFVDVAENNPAAIALYRQAGFAAVGRRPGYYADPNGHRDALVLRANLVAASVVE
ncbi:MAG: GNAT family N-acetyltransferase [Alphaproteobacteria bacterium]|nr:GNAT family N-acetyltransferase [Alphaproteobacteria bacterium]